MTRRLRGWVPLVVACAASSALAGPGSIEGVGRLTVEAGYRWTPNWYFAGRAAEAGWPVSRASPGGPQLAASFGYGATDWFEGTVDILGAAEWFTLDGHQPFSSTTYGLLVGARISRFDAPVVGLVPHLGVQVGPVLATVSSLTRSGSERLLLAYSVNAGLTWRASERYGLTFDARYLLGRVYVEGISGINVGGFWLSLGFTVYFPPTPKRDLDVPGF